MVIDAGLKRFCSAINTLDHRRKRVDMNVAELRATESGSIVLDILYVYLPSIPKPQWSLEYSLLEEEQQCASRSLTLSVYRCPKK